MTEPPAGGSAPAEVVALARRRSAARANRDFAAADALRDEMAAAGWRVADTPDGCTVTASPPYEVLPSVAELPDRSSQADTRRASVCVIVDGWAADLRCFAAALLRHAPDDVLLLALDIGNRGGAGDALHELALARADTATVQVLADPSTIFTGDALTPVLTALEDPDVAGAGWRGARVNDDWLSFAAAGPGEVEVLLGYFCALRRAALLAVPPHPSARFYRNADLELCYAIRAAGLGRLVVPAGTLPLRQARHRGYLDTDPAYREKESKRNYDRFLLRFRGRADLRVLD